MTAIRTEIVPAHRKREKVMRRIVPLTVIMIILVLIIITALSGTNDKSTSANEILKLFENIVFPQIKIVALTGIDIPGLAVYISVAMFVLLLFDAAIGKLFQRKR